LVIRSPENRIDYDAKAALERYRIGWGPADGHHRADQLIFCANHGDVERIARVPVRGVRKSVDVLPRGVMPEIELPDGRRQQVSGYSPDEQERQSEPKHPQSSAPATRLISRIDSGFKPHEQLRSNCTLAVGGMF
jgi:hypothetical protein